jgi:hypothetical protein
VLDTADWILDMRKSRRSIPLTVWNSYRPAKHHLFFFPFASLRILYLWMRRLPWVSKSVLK